MYYFFWQHLIFAFFSFFKELHYRTKTKKSTYDTLCTYDSTTKKNFSTYGLETINSKSWKNDPFEYFSAQLMPTRGSTDTRMLKNIQERFKVNILSTLLKLEPAGDVFTLAKRLEIWFRLHPLTSLLKKAARKTKVDEFSMMVGQGAGEGKSQSSRAATHLYGWKKLTYSSS